jgi:PBP1b-binding outer membrane lipoprotein LpoB
VAQLSTLGRLRFKQKHTMKKYIALTFAVSTLFLAGCCTTHNATNWEYKVAHAPSYAGHTSQEIREIQQTFLNDLGKEGWVLIYENQEQGDTFYFKRPVK